MLYLIGLGLADPDDVSVKGLEIIKSCDKLYLEHYTSKLSCSKEELEEFYGKQVTYADRSFVEGAEQLLAEAKNKHVALLVIGDPLCATTHWDIMTRAKELGISVKVIHNASVINAIGATGLQVYKFGKTTSIPFPKDGFEPESFYDILKQNRSIGAHTLMLLDLHPSGESYMTINQAIQILKKVESKRKEKLISDETKCIGVARLGFQDQKIVSGTVSQVERVDLGAPVHCLIIPGNLHFVEEEAIDLFKIQGQ